MSENGAPPRNGGAVAPHGREDELERALEERDRRLQALRRQLAEREAALAQILASRSWRIVQVLQRLRRLVVPKGSRRARMVRHTLDRTGSAATRLVRRLRRPRAGGWRR